MNDRDSLKITRQQRKEIRERFKRDNTLITSKLRKYLPIMILTNLSVLLLVLVFCQSAFLVLSWELSVVLDLLVGSYGVDIRKILKA